MMTVYPLQKILVVLSVGVACLCATTTALSEDIDPSDPTKIYSNVGVGVKYTDYTNDESMTELRVKGNLGLSKSDMVMFEIGYGHHSGDRVPGDNSDVTNSRVRWFHLFKMQNKPVGYRGMGTQVDVQLAGSLKGTDGQNVVSLGGIAAYSLGEQWKAYAPVNVVNSWDKNFDNHNGTGLSFAPLFVYTPSYLWQGAYLQIWPNWTRFFSGTLDGEGAFNISLTTGGPITRKVMWSVAYQSNHQLDLSTFRRGVDTGLKNDWNVFSTVTTYF